MRRLPGEDPRKLDPTHARLFDGQTVPVPGHRTWAELDADKAVRVPAAGRPSPWRWISPLVTIALVAVALWSCGAIL
ncbi:hypothetical protein [Rhizomonospora bruguierae]|uniref:hypothetical protein n=1 Tax=Rhizomonospora bruguierae TaxID=1581705 RepID=UPI001BD139B5|nr:hypothetical protein [Micromonospora sp. NBRC 107566]